MRSIRAALALHALVLTACSAAQCGGCGSSTSGPASGAPSGETPFAAPAVPASPNRVRWHELFTNDPDAAATFYASVTGWTTQKDGPDHITFVGTGGLAAGVGRLAPDLKSAGVTPYWGVFVQVPDVDATATLAQSRGARIVFGPANVANSRVASVVGEGAVFTAASWNPPLPARDTRTPGEFSWDELVTPDAPGMVALFGALFGWTSLSEVPAGTGGKYLVLARDGSAAAGLFSDPSVKTPSWLSYVQVADLDAAIDRAKRGGGTLTFGPNPLPDGRMAQLRDPQGAVFGLRQTSGDKNRPQ